jgi:hypothetical protein
MADAIRELITEARHLARRLSDQGDRLTARKLSELVNNAEAQWAREENARRNREASVLREVEEFHGRAT